MPVKPLSDFSLNSLLERIDFARQGEVRSITPLSATSIDIRFSVQDIARGFDWIDVMLRIEGVRDAKLVSDTILKTLDMSEGITAEINTNGCAIGIGRYNGRVSEAPCYILGTSMGYKELPFSG